jgi:hypothetical protein
MTSLMFSIKYHHYLSTYSFRYHSIASHISRSCIPYWLLYDLELSRLDIHSMLYRSNNYQYILKDIGRFITNTTTLSILNITIRALTFVCDWRIYTVIGGKTPKAWNRICFKAWIAGRMTNYQWTLLGFLINEAEITGTRGVYAFKCTMINV